MRSPTGMKIPPPNKDAFTLIELTLVAVLLVVLFGLSAPLFKKTFSDLSARDTAFSISRLINYAQEMAVLQRRYYKISFDFVKGKYRLFETLDPSKPASYRKVTGTAGRHFSIPQGLKLTGSRKDMVFYPDGHCDEQKINVLTTTGGYSITTKRFGNVSEIKEIAIE